MERGGARDMKVVRDVREGCGDGGEHILLSGTDEGMCGRLEFGQT